MVGDSKFNNQNSGWLRFNDLRKFMSFTWDRIKLIQANQRVRVFKFQPGFMPNMSQMAQCWRMVMDYERLHGYSNPLAFSFVVSASGWMQIFKVNHITRPEWIIFPSAPVDTKAPEPTPPIDTKPEITVKHRRQGNKINWTSSEPITETQAIELMRSKGFDPCGYGIQFNGETNSKWISASSCD